MSVGEASNVVAAAAVLGAERAGEGALRELPERVRALCEALPAEERLLAAAAGLRQMRLGGARPVAGEAWAEACAEDGVEAGPRAAALLGRVLSEAPEVMDEALGLLRASGRTLPPGVLPEVLEFARKRREARPAVLEVLGERGRWLAAMNPEWGFAAGGEEASEADVEEAWQSGSREQREGLLRRVRERDPARGRALVEGTWQEETPADRARFVAALEVGLSLEDEAFLEGALDDRRKEVRAAAAELLLRLPESALVGRMIERARACVKVTVPKSRSLARRRIGVTANPLSSPDRAMKRDGIESGRIGRLGEKASVLAQLIAAVPPSIWTSDDDVAPAMVIDAAQRSEWCGSLIHGWIMATIRYGNSTWAAALLMTGYAATVNGTGLLGAMMRLLRPADVERVLPVVLQDNKYLACTCISAIEQSWDATSSTNLLTLLTPTIRGADASDWWHGGEARLAAEALAVRLHVSSLPALRESLTLLLEREKAAAVAAACLQKLELRERLHEELSNG